MRFFQFDPSTGEINPRMHLDADRDEELVPIVLHGERVFIPVSKTDRPEIEVHDMWGRWIHQATFGWACEKQEGREGEPPKIHTILRRLDKPDRRICVAILADRAKPTIVRIMRLPPEGIRWDPIEMMRVTPEPTFSGGQGHAYLLHDPGPETLRVTQGDQDWVLELDKQTLKVAASTYEAFTEERYRRAEEIDRALSNSLM